MSSDLHDDIQRRYGAVASAVGATGCCNSDCGCGDPISANLYSETEQQQLPADAVAASLGCGNPTARVDLEEGQTVLDLGSGAGIDVLLSAKRVGAHGKAYGLDMTDEMLALAEANRIKAGATNVEFLKGTIESIPLPDASVDVIVSNCVINLSADKDAVLREAFRVLKPGGRFAVSDVVSHGAVPDDVRRSRELWIGCLAGALDRDDYAARLRTAGFCAVSVEPCRTYDDMFASAFIRAQKPDAACCPSSCCAA